jgi:UDP-N-acetylmuramoyl-L-alanyl-D-glutamate--2,6-diaminopimelate ligase
MLEQRTYSRPRVGTVGTRLRPEQSRSGTMRETVRLLEGLAREPVGAGVPREVSGIAYDSRTVKPGDLFFCIRGTRADGHRFASQALAAGASAIVADAAVSLDPGAPLVEVDDARRALAVVAARFYDFPSRQVQVIGVTGTNGKTSTTYLTASIFEKAGYPSGVIGTLGYRLGDRLQPALMTTPESADLQRYLRHMVDGRIRSVVMEVSSHALVLDRVLGTEFHTVVFTNLGHDHLDFHGTLEEYRRAKERLFFHREDDLVSFGRGRIAVVNADDEAGRDILGKTPLPTVSYGIDRDADVRAEDVALGNSDTSFKIRFPDGAVPVRLHLPGRVNVFNALAAAAAAAASMIDPETIADGLGAVTRVPGRLEPVLAGQPFGVIVDYAHNPPALERLLEGVRQMARGRVLVVFGCGGDRDRAKRPEMARIAARLADVTFVTSDNPRTEDPLEILREVVGGFRPGDRFQVIPDRAEAIEAALFEAREGDVVVIAGKGHEDYQILGTDRIHFDDRETARRILETKWGGGPDRT